MQSCITSLLLLPLLLFFGESSCLQLQDGKKTRKQCVEGRWIVKFLVGTEWD